MVSILTFHRGDGIDPFSNIMNVCVFVCVCVCVCVCVVFHVNIHTNIRACMQSMTSVSMLPMNFEQCSSSKCHHKCSFLKLQE